MFLVHDTIRERHARISRFLDGDDAPIAILLAAADFERTIRRAILGLGSSPTSEIREKLLNQRFHGPDAFKDGWAREVRPRLGVRLADDAITNWTALRAAFNQRNRLIHGSPRKLQSAFASKHARAIMMAAQQLHEFALADGVDLDRTIRRYKRRESPIRPSARVQ